MENLCRATIWIWFPRYFASAKCCSYNRVRETNFPKGLAPNRHFWRGCEFAQLYFQIELARLAVTMPESPFRPIRAMARNICREDFPAEAGAIRFREISSIRQSARPKLFLMIEPPANLRWPSLHPKRHEAKHS